VRSERKADLKNGFIYAKTLEWQFCKYTRGGSNKIRDRPAPGIGAICVTRNRPVTSTGRGIPARVGAGVRTTTRGSNGPQNVTQLTNDHPSRMKVMLQ
jgi:hypothetical protein